MEHWKEQKIVAVVKRYFGRCREVTISRGLTVYSSKDM